ncbi:MAG: hypothetical protein ACREYE_06875 [Gammaproteobacteria bacterium]
MTTPMIACPNTGWGTPKAAAPLRRNLEDHYRPFDRLRTGIEDPTVIAKFLTHLALPARAPPRRPARPFDRFQLA